MSSSNHNQMRRGAFATRIGAIATAVGSAVGLGNIWRFPYEAGTNGGGAFLIIYLFFIAIVGIPLLCAEFAMGRDSRANAVKTFASLTGRKSMGAVGVMGIVASVLILSFYSVVAGWTIEYTIISFSRGFKSTDVETLHSLFNSSIASPAKSLFFTWLFLLINYFALARGVRKGIERLSNLLMPVLFLILIVFCVNSLMLPDAGRGLRFLFAVDFSQVSVTTVLSAMGQAFFSLSIGLGCMLTYGSYFKDSTIIPRTAVSIASLDTLVAILSGIIIFPAVFSFGMSPTAGPTLVFETLPAIFGAMAGGRILAPLFFILLFIASLTSTISMSEISISFCTEQFGWSRKKASAAVIGLSMALGGLCALSFGPLANFKICSLTVFNLFDFASSNVLLPLGGVCASLIAGWAYPRSRLAAQLSLTGNKLFSVIRFLLRYIIPFCILLIFINSL